MIITQTYPNGFQRQYEVLSVEIIDDAGIMMTTESGAVAVSQSDTPDIWAQLTALGLV